MSIIFISHAVVDKLVIDDFFDLLQTGCNLKLEDIFCSSVEGAGIKTGEDFVKWIHAHLDQSQIVILFLTPNYYASHFCLAEMGAAWALKKDIFLILIPEMKREAGLVMLGRQTAVADETGLDDLRDAIAKHYPPAAETTARWSVKKEQFLEKFRAKLKKLPTPQLVDRSQVDAERERTAAAMELNTELIEEKETLLKQMAALEKAKDAADVAKIKDKFTPKNERYEKLVATIHDHLSNLTQVEVRCVYASITEELWQPGRDDYKYYEDAIKKAQLSQRINEESDFNGERGLTANRDHPKLRPVFKAINNLEEFIEHEMSSKDIKLLEEKHGFYIQTSNIEYWEKVLYESHLPP